MPADDSALGAQFITAQQDRFQGVNSMGAAAQAHLPAKSFAFLDANLAMTAWARQVNEYAVALKGTADYLQRLGTTIRESVNLVANGFENLTRRLGTFRIESAGFPVIAESSLEGVTLTALARGEQFDAYSPWWETIVDQARGFQFDINKDWVDTSDSDFPEFSQGALAGGAYADVFAGVDAKLARFSHILVSRTVFLPRVHESKARWSRERAELRMDELTAKFHQTNSPTLSLRSLYVPSWDRSLQVRA